MQLLVDLAWTACVLHLYVSVCVFHFTGKIDGSVYDVAMRCFRFVCRMLGFDYFDGALFKVLDGEILR